MSIRRNRHWRKTYLKGAFKHHGRQFNCLNCMHPVAAHNNGVCLCEKIGYIDGVKVKSPCDCARTYNLFVPLRSRP